MYVYVCIYIHTYLNIYIYICVFYQTTVESLLMGVPVVTLRSSPGKNFPETRSLLNAPCKMFKAMMFEDFFPLYNVTLFSSPSRYSQKVSSLLDVIQKITAESTFETSPGTYGQHTNTQKYEHTYMCIYACACTILTCTFLTISHISPYMHRRVHSCAERELGAGHGGGAP